MNFRALCKSHILLGVYLVATPVFAQSTSAPVGDEGQLNTIEEPIDTQVETGDDLVPDVAIEPVVTTRQRPAAHQPTGFIQNNTDKLLAILALLFLWLLTRKENQRIEESVRPARKAPVTAEELGRAVYAVARSADLTGFRTLHVDGREAGAALGVDAATQYLQNRTQDKLARDITELSDNIPLGAQYKSCKIKDDRITITVITPIGELVEIDAGKAIQIGAVLRLV
jgi:hypothetical protein